MFEDIYLLAVDITRGKCEEQPAGVRIFLGGGGGEGSEGGGGERDQVGGGIFGGEEVFHADGDHGGELTRHL